MKLKVNPSLRIKRRYMFIQGAEKEDIEKIILDYLGILGFAKASPVFVASNIKERVILAVERKEVDNIRAAFELSRKNIKILKVSGTMKGLSN